MVWDSEKEIQYTGKEGELETLPHTAWYDGEKSDLKIIPENIANKDESIEIEDKFLGQDGKYYFMVRFIPPLQPGERRTYKYQIVPTKARPIDMPYVATGWFAKRGYDRTVLSVQFDPRALPYQGRVWQVYWPDGIHKDPSQGCRRLHQFIVDEENNYQVRVAFERSEVEHLLALAEEKDLGQLRYGLVWEWEPIHEDEL